MTIRRSLALAVTAGLLALGSAACGKSPSKPASAAAPASSAPAAAHSPSPSPTASPSPARSPVPLDKESCAQAKKLADTVALRMPELRRSVDRQIIAFALDIVRDTIARANDANPRVTDSRVRPIIEEYLTRLDQEKQRLEAYQGDRDKALSDLDAMADKLASASQRLNTLCAAPKA